MGMHNLSGNTIAGSPVHGHGPRWYVANVFTGREKNAEVHLRNQGFVTFNPIENRTVRHARRLVTKQKSLFPGYLFVRIDIEIDRWRNINSTRGVKALIMQLERPVACPSGFVEKLLEVANENGVVDTSCRLQPGQKVKVKTGPFVEFVGTLERLDNSGRARVLLEIMSGKLPVQMESQHLETL